MNSTAPHPLTPPLFDYHWNEHESIESFNKGLVIILGNDLNGKPHAIGTGFIVSSDDQSAICATAAHIFSEVRRLQSPPPRHNPSALPEFLPPNKPIQLDKKNLHVISLEAGRIESTQIENLIFDESSDIAFFHIRLNDISAKPFFSHAFILDASIPAIGELVCIFSYGDLGVLDYEPFENSAYGFKLKLRPVVRVGRVLNYYPDGHRLCRGPCIETSIPVYSGMSGGLVCRYGTEGPIKPFGVVSSDPDLDSKDKQNRSFEGRSIIALLPSEIIKSEDSGQTVRFTFANAEVTGQAYLSEQNKQIV